MAVAVAGVLALTAAHTLMSTAARRTGILTVAAAAKDARRSKAAHWALTSSTIAEVESSLPTAMGTTVPVPSMVPRRTAAPLLFTVQGVLHLLLTSLPGSCLHRTVCTVALPVPVVLAAAAVAVGVARDHREHLGRKGR